MSYLLRRIIRNPYMFMAKALWSIEGPIFSKFVNNSFCLVVVINTGRPYSSLASICSRSFVLGLSSICHLSKYHYNILMPPPPPILHNHCFQFLLGRFLQWRIAIQFCEALWQLWWALIALIDDTHHLCTRLMTDGMKATSRGFLRGKQLINHVRF